MVELARSSYGAISPLRRDHEFLFDLVPVTLSVSRRHTRPSWVSTIGAAGVGVEAAFQRGQPVE
jgi:hypothetical protein